MALIQNETIGDLDIPTIPESPSSIALPASVRNYELKTIHFNMMPSFNGMSIEDPLAHIRDIFNMVSNMALVEGVTKEHLRMKIFYKGLTVSNKNAVNNYARGSIKNKTLAGSQALFDTLTLETHPSNDPYSNTYNQGWRNHPNLSWVKNQNVQKPSSAEPVAPPVKPYVPLIPFPQRLKKNKLDEKYFKFLEMFKKLKINIPFVDALEQMSNYAKFMKDIISRKRKFGDHEKIQLTEECSAILQRKLPLKQKDRGSFKIPCIIGTNLFEKALCDFGSSINLLPLSIAKNIGMCEIKPTTVSLQMADKSIAYPEGIIEDVLVKGDKLIFPTDFLVLDMEEDYETQLILGRPFLITARTLIDVEHGVLTLRIVEEKATFKVFEVGKFPREAEDCFRVDLVDTAISEKLRVEKPSDPMEAALVHAVTSKDENQTFSGMCSLLGCF
ncbi:uncharacterized protein [Malus domestica]|uniref:uncharacterized protein n=1 Tax=Malus domestica TaxID=3750 RepID=UPI003976AF1C